jgi:UDP-2-acetamido-2-deoxy-ribo-hexuluronate aminotransferase
MREIRAHGQQSRYYHTRVGINGRLDTIQCAILIPKLERFEWELSQRTARAVRYNRAFHELSSLGVVIPQLMEQRTSSWAQYTLQVPKRENLQKALQAKGVPTAVHYPRTMPDQPAYTKSGRVLDITTSRKMAEVVMSLPMYPDLTDELQDYVIEQVMHVTKQELTR